MRWKGESFREGTANVKAVWSEDAQQMRAATRRPELPQGKEPGAV